MDLFIEEDRRPQQAVYGARVALSQAVDAIAKRLRDGGRLFYLGPGRQVVLVCWMPPNVHPLL